MAQVALAWLLNRGVASPIIGATKTKYIDDAVGAVDLALSAEDMATLEEMYIPHEIMGAIKPNQTPQVNGSKQANQK